MGLLEDWNKNKFSIYKNEEKTVLKLIESLGKWTEELIKSVSGKTDLYGDHKGSWQGLNRPTLSEEGMRSIVEKINDIDLPTINEELETKKNLTDKHLNMINDKLDTVGTTNIANFAGQKLGAYAPIGQIFHHYTDGILAQLDNVGENNSILVLKNANNPSRRPDKDPTFIGNGHFIDCIQHNPDGSSSIRKFRINYDGNFYWFDKKTPVLLYNYKDDDGQEGFIFNMGKPHAKLLSFKTGNDTDFIINHNMANNYLELVSGNNSQGFIIQSAIGDVNIKPGSGKCYINGEVFGYDNGSYGRLIQATNGATRPIPKYIGQPHFDTNLGKPIWCKQYTPSVIWVDATGTTV